MPLIIVAAGAGAGSAAKIPQQFAIRTRHQRVVGTANMFNCMGLVIHSPQYQIGCLAHIEAEVIPGAYTTAFRTYVIYMVSKIIKYGGLDPNLQAALFGNQLGPNSQIFTNNIEGILASAQIRRTEITDQRNTTGGGPHHFAGAVARIAGAGVITGITYNPATGTVAYYGAGGAITESGAWYGIRRKQLQ